MSYYDIDAILTESQKLPCTFEIDVPGLGYLDGNAGQTVRLFGNFSYQWTTIRVVVNIDYWSP
jgi:hypothetical protein